MQCLLNPLRSAGCRVTLSVPHPTPLLKHLASFVTHSKAAPWPLSWNPSPLPPRQPHLWPLSSFLGCWTRRSHRAHVVQSLTAKEDEARQDGTQTQPDITRAWARPRAPVPTPTFPNVNPPCCLSPKIPRPSVYDLLSHQHSLGVF